MINPFVTLSRSVAQLSGVKRKSGVSIERQLRDLMSLRRTSGIGRAEYFKYRLWRPELDGAERLTYTSERERRLTENATNPRGSNHLRRTKSEMVAALADAGLQVPELAGRVSPTPAADTGVTTAHDIRTLAALLGSLRGEAVVFKPERGMQGQGIMIVTAATSSGVTLLSGQHLGVPEVWSRLMKKQAVGWRIERWVRPHPALFGFRPGTTPTVRLLTLLVDGGVTVHAASLKLPIGNSGVDNLAQGNLVAAVDIETGIIGSATDGSGVSIFDRHPQSGIPITGLQLPHWNRVQSAALDAAPALSPLRALGWDIAITAEGPVVLEVNAAWCEKLIQLPAGHGLTRGPFIRLLHEVGGADILAKRRAASPEWTAFEKAAL